MKRLQGDLHADAINLSCSSAVNDLALFGNIVVLSSVFYKVEVQIGIEIHKLGIIEEQV